MMSLTSGHVVAIMGATATGKTKVAVQLAESLGGEIVSMDSRQVYRAFEIGTAKPSASDRRRIPHHLIDILDPSDIGNVGRHIRLVDSALQEIFAEKKMAFLVGGTGLYFRAYFDGLIDVDIPSDQLRAIRQELDKKTTSDLYLELTDVDSIRAAELSANDRVRISRALEVYRSTGKTHSKHLEMQPPPENRPPDLRIVLTLPRAMLRERIAQRTREMFQAGWVEEVAGLIAKGLTLETPAMNSLGYRSIAQAILAGDDPYQMSDRVITLTHQYAKRQETFFRSLPDAHWIDVNDTKPVDNIKQLIAQWV